MMLSIYLISNKINGKQYVGQTLCSPAKRWQEHIYNAQGNPARSAYPLYHAIRKYEAKSFCVSVLDSANSQEELNEKEIEYIYAYNTMDKNFGYNRHKGGNRPPVSTPESRRKAGLAMKGRKFSKEHCDKISKALSGRKLPPERVAKMCGRPVTDETRKKMSASGGWRKGLKSSPEHVAKIAAALIGKKHSDESKQKMSIAKSNPSEETRRKLRESHLGIKCSEATKEKKRNIAFLKTVAWG